MRDLSHINNSTHFCYLWLSSTSKSYKRYEKSKKEQNRYRSKRMSSRLWSIYAYIHVHSFHQGKLHPVNSTTTTATTATRIVCLVLLISFFSRFPPQFYFYLSTFPFLSQRQDATRIRPILPESFLPDFPIRRPISMYVFSLSPYVLVLRHSSRFSYYI